MDFFPNEWNRTGSDSPLTKNFCQSRRSARTVRPFHRPNGKNFKTGRIQVRAMNEQDRKDEARIARRSHNDNSDDDHGRVKTSWMQRLGGRMKKGNY
jgi:hypothetical protein